MIKKQTLIIICVAAVVFVLLMLLLFRNGKLIENGGSLVKKLESQNKQLIKQNESLISTVEKLNVTIDESVRRDSAFIVLNAEQLQLLPGIDQNVSTIKKQYDKDAIHYRNLDARGVESYIAAEARRLRNE